MVQALERSNKALTTSNKALTKQIEQVAYHVKRLQQ
jgi:hypothetical protein